MAAPSDSDQTSPAPPRSRWARATSDAAGGDRAEALRELAGSYWYCVYAWWRRAGLDAGEADTATVASFTRWLGEAPPSPEESGVGRMREWLPARLAELAAAGVKMSGPAALAIEATWAAQRYADEPPGEPDSIFQRRWALTVLEFTTTTLQGEYAVRGEEVLFNELLPFAGFEPGDDERYASAAARVGRTSGAMRRAVFDFRSRQRELLRAYAGDTVLDPAHIDSELTALLCACESAGVQMTPLPGAAPITAPLPTVIRALRPDEVFARAMQSVRMTQSGAGGWQPPTVAEAARLFPQYEVLSLLGRGGMGAVYKARQIELDRLVAIKLLPLEVSVDRDFADRFRREARAMAKLDHPNIIAVYDFGNTAEGHLFFVMAFVDGSNLDQLIHKNDLPIDQALAIVGQVCTALAYAHGKGIVHRDIKPANVMVAADGRAKVADFGLARLTEAAPESFGMTQTGTVLGTPDYMAPEQMKAGHVDHRADIYSLGVMLYEMLCREVPKGAFERPSERIGCAPRIDQIVLKAMQQAPERRYQSTTDMKADVDAALESRGRRKRNVPPGGRKSRVPLWIGLVVVAVGAGLYARFGLRPRSDDARSAIQTPVPVVAAPAASTPATLPNASPVAVPSGAAPKSVAASATPIASPQPSTPIPAQPSEVLTFAGHRYQLIPDEADWNAAKTKAESLGGHLATFLTEEEALWARDHLIVPLKVNELRRYAIGGGAAEESTEIKWLNGTPVGKIPWISGNPLWRAKLDTDEKKQPAGLYAVRLKDGGSSWIGMLPVTAKLAGFIIEWDDGTPDPAPTPPPVAVATPAPPPSTPMPKPQTEVEKWLAQVDAQQQEAFVKQVTQPFETSMAELRKQHAAALESGLARATASKQLTEAIAWQKELKTFQESRTVTGSDVGLPSRVQLLRAAFRNQSGELARWRATKTKGARAAYDAILSQKQDALTKLLRLEDALLLQQKREELVKLWPLPGEPIAVPAAAGAPTAGKEKPAGNLIGMKFVPVKITGGPTDGQQIYFSVWETRVADYRIFVNETKRKWDKPGFAQQDNHPAVNVTWEDATAFCAWLSKRDGRNYRLPSDHEWSCAVGIGDREDANAIPHDKAGKINGIYPWQGGWPPTKGSGNFADAAAERQKAKPDNKYIASYDDGFAWTSPVGSFSENEFGLYDLSGNAREWCADWADKEMTARVMRGGSWYHGDDALLSSARDEAQPRMASGLGGFRVVLVPAPLTPSAASAPAFTPALGFSAAGQGLAARASKDLPFMNSLEMKFVPVPIEGSGGARKKLLFSSWETRVQDYEVFVNETKTAWTKPPGDSGGPKHPAVNLGWKDAQNFCDWLTRREQLSGKLRASERYRLPTDLEWSAAIGSRQHEDPSRTTPTDRSGKIQEFPWGTEWPPPKGAGNYSGEECKGQRAIPGYRDLFPASAPVGNFKPNRFGLYDLGGNVWELCEDLHHPAAPGAWTMRGASYAVSEKGPIWWTARESFGEGNRGPTIGFRVVLAIDP